MTVFTTQVENQGTVYRIHYTYPDSVRALFEGGPGIYMLETGSSQNNGQWVRLLNNTVAWSYLTEKLPALTEGDKEGWVAAFRQAGVEVFN